MNFVLDKKMEDAKPLKSKMLLTRTAVQLLLEGKLRTNVCRYCLNIDDSLWEMDRVMNVAIKGTSYMVSIRTMVASFHHIKVDDDPNFPNKICEKCLEQTLSCYIFSQQCEKSERALRNCFEDVYERLSKLDPIEQNAKKRGRQKQNPNYNTLYVAHKNVTDYAEPIISIINTKSYLTDKSKIEIVPNECPKCWQEFPNLSLLRNHEKIHPKTMWYHCRLCGKSFPKANHLKRHVFSAHKYPLTPKTEQDFKCKECGFLTQTYSQHLQHVERHKFHTFMKHLVENKMDKICTVCLDKRNGLTEVDKMICFHGGSPGLTGDVKLTSIIQSTFGDKNMNKYQELHIPTLARVVQMRRKRAMVPDVLHSKYYFIFAKPIYIDTEKITESHHVLDEVDLCYESTNNEIQINLITTLESNNVEDKNHIKNIQPSVESEKPSEIQICNNKTLATKICKKCWIFSRQCICENSYSTDQNNSITEKCKYCWIFKNVDKCHYCSKQSSSSIEIDEIDMPSTVAEANKITVDQKENVVGQKQVNAKLHKQINSETETVESTNSDYIYNIRNKKRKNEEEHGGIVNKKTKLEKEHIWVCRICLTQNTINKQNCLCCDFDSKSNNNMKFNFSNTSHFNLKNDKCSTDKTENIPDKVDEQASTSATGPDFTVSNTNVIQNVFGFRNFDNREPSDSVEHMYIDQSISNVNDTEPEPEPVTMEICYEENQCLAKISQFAEDIQDETVLMRNNEPLKIIEPLGYIEPLHTIKPLGNMEPLGIHEPLSTSNFVFNIGSGPGNNTKKRMKRKFGTSRS